MKKIFFLPVLFAAIFSACKESPILIPEIQAGNRNVLVEEITGVRCQACPQGSAELVRLDSIYGDNLIVVSVHAAGNFSFPYSANEGADQDFRMPKAEELALYIGELPGYPTASFDRHVFAPNPSPFLSNPGSWGGFVAQQLGKPAEVTLSLNTSYDDTDRKLEMDISIAPEANLIGDLRITVMITEDKIVDPQKVGADLVPDYVHRHVLRDIVTPALGSPISEAFIAGEVITKRFEATLPADWVVNNCSVVAFVHQNNGNTKDVLQATEVHLHE